MEDTMTLQLVVWSLSHKHLRQTQLHIRLRKHHWLWLPLSHTDFVCTRHSTILVGIVDWLSSLLQNNIQEFDTKLLRLSVIIF